MRVFGFVITRSSVFEKLKDGLEELTLLKGTVREFVKGIINNEPVALTSNQCDQQIVDDLTALQQFIDSMLKEANLKNWHDSNLSKINQLINNHFKEQDDLFSALVKELVKSVKANQGGLFLIDDPENPDYQIALKACYAYDKKRFETKVLEKGQGLVGQCILERDTLLIKDVPQFYVKITSGLGESTPHVLLIVPLITHNNVVGAIELASFHEFESHHIQLIESLAQSIALKVEDLWNSTQLKSLYEQATRQEDVIKMREQEMQLKIEQLESAYEEIERKNQEIKEIRLEEQYLLESKLQAQQQSYELIINSLKRKLNQLVLT